MLGAGKEYVRSQSGSYALKQAQSSNLNSAKCPNLSSLAVKVNVYLNGEGGGSVFWSVRRTQSCGDGQN